MDTYSPKGDTIGSKLERILRPVQAVGVGCAPMRRIPALLLVALGSCSRTDPEPTPPATTSAPVVASSAPAPAPLVKEPTPCPTGMLEVRGSYCPTVLHQCVKGARNHDGSASTGAMPYYCDGYREGYAKCFGKEVPKHFCIDEFEYPNREGAMPEVFVSWYEAKEACEKQGKRLCDDDEWTLACEGPERWPYPYGWHRDAGKCNIDKRWIQPNDGILARKVRDGQVEEELARLSQAVPSGSMPGCVSPYGVKDMGGNVDEWAVNVTLGGKPYQSIFKGGHWCGGARNRCRPTTESHDETTRYYSQGFRCCAAPAGDGGK